jgi:hypothetical protein
MACKLQCHIWPPHHLTYAVSVPSSGFDTYFSWPPTQFLIPFPQRLSRFITVPHNWHFLPHKWHICLMRALLSHRTLPQFPPLLPVSPLPPLMFYIGRYCMRRYSQTARTGTTTHNRTQSLPIGRPEIADSMSRSKTLARTVSLGL